MKVFSYSYFNFNAIAGLYPAIVIINMRRGKIIDNHILKIRNCKQKVLKCIEQKLQRIL